MGQEYRIDRKRRFVLSAGFGDVTSADLLVHHRRLLRDPDFDPSLHHVIDLTLANECVAACAVVKMFAGNDFLSPNSRRAFVVDDADALALTAEYQCFREALGDALVRVFNEFDAAVAWLLASESTA